MVRINFDSPYHAPSCENNTKTIQHSAALSLSASQLPNDYAEVKNCSRYA
jgi:hypothetical protein